MTNYVESRTVKAALESEISVIEEARDSLPEDSHLIALCYLAVERLADFVTQPQSLAESMQDETRFLLSA